MLFYIDGGRRSSVRRVERKHLDPADYVIENLNGSVACKPPGSVGGQQFVVRNCRDSSVYLMDHAGSVTVDDCQRCTIVLGPTRQRCETEYVVVVVIIIDNIVVNTYCRAFVRSVFVRDTTDSTVVVACGQFRVRDCSSLKISLFCSTQPVIESSRQLQFGCYQLYYDRLAGEYCTACCVVVVWLRAVA